MTKKIQRIIVWIVAIMIILIVGFVGFAGKGQLPFLRSTVQTTNPSEVVDEFTGTWRGEGTTKDGYKWFVVYTFKNGTYTMATDSAMKDNGTYVIAKRFLDGSVQMTKTSILFKKTYDVFNTFTDDGKTVTIDGMKLYKQ